MGLQKYLINVQKTFCRHIQREVLLEFVLIHGVLPFFCSCHVVPHVPHVNFAVELITVLFTLKEQWFPCYWLFAGRTQKGRPFLECCDPFTRDVFSFISLTHCPFMIPCQTNQNAIFYVGYVRPVGVHFLLFNACVVEVTLGIRTSSFL